MWWGFLGALVFMFSASVFGILVAFQMGVRAAKGEVFRLQPKPIVPSTLRTPAQENLARKRAQMTELQKLERMAPDVEG